LDASILTVSHAARQHHDISTYPAVLAICLQGRLPTPTEHFDVAMQAAGITPSDGLADVLANTFW
jgi:hypothetical protein